jgi:hypothetical protein
MTWYKYVIGYNNILNKENVPNAFMLQLIRAQQRKMLDPCLLNLKTTQSVQLEILMEFCA